MIVWFTGQPGAGKTTLAQELYIPLVDGDDLRELMPNPGYDEAGRRKNIDRAQAIAAYLARNGVNVAVALVAPYRDQREEFKARGDVLEVYVHTDETRGREGYHVADYEPPEHDFLDLDTGELTIEQAKSAVHRAMATFARRTYVAVRPEAKSRSAAAHRRA